MKYKITMKEQLPDMVDASYWAINLETQTGYPVWTSIVYPKVEELSPEKQLQVLIDDMKDEIKYHKKQIQRMERILNEIQI